MTTRRPRSGQAEADVAATAPPEAPPGINQYQVRSPFQDIGKSAFTPGALVTAGGAISACASLIRHVDITQSSQDEQAAARSIHQWELRSAEEAPVRLKLENGAMYPHEAACSLRRQRGRKYRHGPCAPVQSRTYFVARAYAISPRRGRKRLAVPGGRCAARSEGRASVSFVTATRAWKSGLSTWAAPSGDSWAIRCSGLKPDSA